MSMIKKDVLEHFGGVVETARALGVSHASVSGWDDVPIGRQFQIEVITKGALKANNSHFVKTDKQSIHTTGETQP